VCLLLGLYVATLIRHGAQLEEERNVARDVQEAFVGFFTAPDPGDRIGLGEGRRDLTVREAILEGADRVREDLADRPAARAELFAAMAAVLTDLDERGPAYELAREALELQEGLHGPSSPQVHEALRLVGDLAPNADSARALLEWRLELGRSLYGPNHSANATTLEYLAVVEDRVSNFEEARALLEESARIHRLAGSVDAQGLAWTLGRLAENQLRLGRPAEAVSSSREAYAIMVGARGPEHSSSAMHGVKLAMALRSAGEVDEARRMFESSLAVLDRELGPSHGTTLASRGNYALLLLQIEDYPAAEAVQRELLQAHRDRYGEASSFVADALQNLAVNLKDQRRYAEADSLLEEAHRIYLSTRGADYFRTAYPLLTLAEIRLIREDFPGAETAAREATLILRSALPEGHYAIAVGECRWGRALAGLGERARALELLAAAARVLEPFDDAGMAAYREECLSALAVLLPA
jgi:eukaryotic-like serine/threonine-protein kinase